MISHFNIDAKALRKINNERVSVKNSGIEMSCRLGTAADIDFLRLETVMT